ncbi:MAG: hypothetical protein HYU36_20835 [Planctomycetes bacterium]|nr:hypothetical protein [Planctomycetota bacterium]
MALFDTGATYTYVRASLLAKAPRRRVKKPVRVALGGQKIAITEICLMDGKIEGLSFFGDAVPVKNPGPANGHALDAIIGALTLERWEIQLDPRKGTLDLNGLRRREFTEY